jgi:NADH-quinone oxidoreductase subunit H
MGGFMTPVWGDPIKYFIEWVRELLLGWGLAPEMAHFVMSLVGGFALATGAMLFVIFLIWYERKLIGRIQDRLGPNRIGPWGIFQPIADMLKIFIKEFITPAGADWLPYNLAPVLSVGSVLMIWAVVPFMVSVYGVDLNVGILYLIATGGLGTLSILLAGWGSNNKYALLGGFRSIALLLSYEVPMVVCLLIPVMYAQSMSINSIVKAQDIWFIVTAPVAALIFFITSVAEVGRAPFDLVEAESELVAGFNVEYSGLKFGMFFVAEFLHAFTISLLFSVLFLGGWKGPFSEQIPILGFVYLVIKTFIVYLVVILLRGSLPRFRIDQMMDLNWKILTPISLVIVMLTALVDKSVSGLSPVIRVVVLLAVNAVVLLATNALLRRNFKPHERKVVSKKRPVAVYHPEQS